MPRKSVLDLLDEFPSCSLPFEVFLDLLPPLRPRDYSISSSPLVSADTCSITVGVVDAPARSGNGVFRGICSNYLALQPVDATVYGFIHKPSIPFCPPENPHLPMIMVGPGTGVAPFRGFLQETGGAEAAGRSGWRVDAVLRLPRSAARFSLRGRAAGVRGGWGHAVVRGLLARARQAEDLRAAGDQGAERGRVAAASAGGHDFVCGEASRMAPTCGKRSPACSGSAPAPRHRTHRRG